MEDIKRKLQEYLNQEAQYDKEEELELYQLTIKKDLFRFSKNKIDFEILLFLLYNCQNNNSFKENLAIINDLLKTNIFQKNGVLFLEIIDLIDNLLEYELFYLIEFLELTNMSVMLQIKNKEKIEKLKQIISNNYHKLNELEHNGVKKNDLLSILTFYKNSSSKEQKVFKIMKYYISSLIIYNHTINFSINYLNGETRNILQCANNLLLDHVNELEREKKNFYKNDRKIKRLYQKRLLILNTRTEEDYLELEREEIDSFPIELLEKMECFFTKHNKKIVEPIEKELNDLEKDKKITIQNLFYENNIAVSEEILNLVLLSGLSIEDLEMRIKDFAEMNQNITELLSLFISDPLIYNSIILLLKNQIISFNYLKENLAVLLDQELAIQLNETYNFFKEQGFQDNYLNELLFLDKKFILERVLEAKRYKIAIGKGILKNYFFETIDIWIEMGFYPYLEKNNEIANLDFINITKRMIIARQLGLPIFYQNGQLTSLILEERKFLFLNEELDNYISNQTVFYEMQEIDADIDGLLENETELYLQIDQITLSKPKIKRNLQNGLKGFKALIHGSILDLVTLEELKKNITNKSELKLLQNK